MRKLIYPVIAIALIAAGFGGGWVSADHDLKERQTAFNSSTYDAPYPTLNPADIAAKVNEQRAMAGLPTLAYSAQLEASACAKADDMIANNYWAHTSPDGTQPWHFFNQAGYRYFKAGENLAYGQRSDTGVVNGWMNSATHKANIMADFSEQGMCVRYGDFRGGKNAVIVNHFGRRL